MEIEIQEVQPHLPAYEEIWMLRDAVLRKPLGLDLSRTETLSEKDQVHLAAYRSGSLLGCVLLVPADNEIKLRQMAVAPSAQGQGIGKKLLEAAEKTARDRGYKIITCHARETALGFYKSNGWEVEGERFTEVSIPHFSMKKQLL